MGLPSPITITVESRAAAIATATAVLVRPLDAALLSGTVLTFTGGTVATLTAHAAIDATSITVAALAGPIASRETATTTEGYPVRPLRMVSATMPAPTLDDDGRPVGWAPTSTSDTPHGLLEVFIDGDDRTYVLGHEVVIEEWSSADPFGDIAATIRFPQFSPFHVVGVDDWDYVRDGAPVEINLLDFGDPGGLPRWEGFVDSWDIADDGLTVHLTGALLQADLYVRAPPVRSESTDIGGRLLNEWTLGSNRPALQTATPYVDSGPVGVDSIRRGGWEPPPDYAQDLLEETLDDDGDQWTILMDRPRTPRVCLRDRSTVLWVTTVGAEGVAVQVHREWRTAYNVIYGEGIDQSGSVWRNLFVPTNSLNSDLTVNSTPTGEVFYSPLAGDPDVMVVFNEATWEFEDSTGLDPNKLRRERFINFGYMDLSHARAIAARLIDRSADPGYVFTVTLKGTGLEAGHNIDIEAGQNITVKELDGSGPTGMTGHIVGVTHRLNGNRYESVLTCDTKGRSATEVFDIVNGNRKKGNTLGRRIEVGRDSSSIKDDRIPWDHAAGAGVIPHDRHRTGTSVVSLTAETWTVVRFLAAEADTITQAQFVATDDTPFHVSLYDYKIDTSDLPSDPFAAHDTWDEPPTGFIVGWGGVAQRAGFSPGFETRLDETGATVNDPATGVLSVGGSWSFDHNRWDTGAGYPDVDGDEDNCGSPPYLWAAFYASDDCDIYGFLLNGGTS